MRRAVPFAARVHPGRLIGETSPCLTLTTDAIPLYDPSNFTIVSCDQADWDLGDRIMQSGRMGRLEGVCRVLSGRGERDERAGKGQSHADRAGGQTRHARGEHLLVRRPSGVARRRPFAERRLLPSRQGAGHQGISPPTIGGSAFKRAVHRTISGRIIAALIPAGEFCNHKVNYLPGTHFTASLQFVSGPAK